MGKHEEFSYKINQNINVNVSGEGEVKRLTGELEKSNIEVKRLVGELEQADVSLASASDRIRELENYIERLSDQKGVTELKKQIEQFSSTAKRSLTDFKAFLRSVSLEDMTGDFANSDISKTVNKLSEGIKAGSVTVNEAISQIKLKYSDLINTTSKSSGLESGLLDGFTADLRKVETVIEEISQKIDRMQTEGVRTVGSVAPGSAVEGEINDVAVALEKLSNAANNVGAEADGSYTGVTNLVNAIKELASGDVAKLNSIALTFKGIAGLSGGSVSDNSVKNILEIARELNKIQGEMGNLGSFKLDFSGLKDLTIRKTSLANLAEYLPEIAKVPYANLEKVASVDFSKYNNLKINKASLSGIQDFVKAVSDSFETLKSINLEEIVPSEGAADVAKHTEAFDDASEAIKNYAAVKKATIGTDIIKENGVFVSPSGRWDTIAQQYNDASIVLKKYASDEALATMSVKEREKAYKQLFDTEAKYRAASEKTNKTEQATEAYNNATEAIKNYAAAQKAAIGTDIIEENGSYVSPSGKWGTLAQQYNDAEAALSKFMSKEAMAVMNAEQREAVYKRFVDVMANYEVTLEKVTAAEGSSKAVAKAKKDIKEYFALLNQLKKAKADIAEVDGVWVASNTSTDADAGTGVKTDADWSNSVSRLNNLRESYMALTAEQKESIFTSKQIAELDALIADQAEKHAVAVEKHTNAENERMDANLKRAEGEINRARKLLKSASGAEYSSKPGSRDSYNEVETHIGKVEELAKSYAKGEISAKEFTDSIDDLALSTTKANNVFENNNEKTKKFGDRVRDNIKRLTAWISVADVMMKAVQTVKQMVTNVISLDTAMTELKKVTDESDTTYAKFLDNAAARSKKLGATLVDTVNATSDFARLGYGIEEAEKLADASAIYKNVGDGIEDIGAASESIISTMQAFGIEATDAMSIVDKFNEVGKVVPNGIVICRKKTAISVKSQRWSRPRKDLMFYMIKHHLSVTTVMLYMATYRASLSPCYTG